jgi:orotate phosphoribosyltransferase
VTTTREAATTAARAAVAARTEELFRRAGALREGHFRLKSGRHSDRYLEKFQVLQYPEITSELCSMLAASGRDAGGRPVVDVVAGPTTGGVILAFETARQLGVRSLFAEEVHDDAGTRREFRRGFTILPGERVLLVDDILTTGGSLAAMLPAVEGFGAEIVHAVVLVDRSGGHDHLTSPDSGREYPLDALWRLELPTWEAGAGCPACLAGAPLEEPGSGGTGSGPAGRVA